jgi:hypothetical protein
VGAGAGVAAGPQADNTRLVSTSTVNIANRFLFILRILLSSKDEFEIGCQETNG